ncbi:MAG: hypothetical protein JRH20_03975 [Deltaproteobacteria bacterium]|nr:hypothetical protein [Deltaproteobacteria bacterium]
MITLRCTKKLQRHLAAKPEPEDKDPTSALGDWYGNVVVPPAGPPMVLVTNERSLLSVLLPHDGDVFTEFKRHVIALLRRLDIPQASLERETFHLQQIRVGKTKSRQVLGTMNDTALQVQARLAEGMPLEEVEDVLAKVVYSMNNQKYPLDVARELLGGPPARPKARTTPQGDSTAPPLSLVVDRRAQKKKGPGQQGPRLQGPPALEGCRVPITLTPRERELIIEHAMLAPDLTEPLETAPADSGALEIGYTLEDLDELRSYLSGEAKHSKNKTLKGELVALHDRLKTEAASYDNDYKDSPR